MAKEPTYSKEISDRYNISEELQPGTVHFGESYGHVTINLATASVEDIDEFVKRFMGQPFFKPKSAPQKDSGKERSRRRRIQNAS